MLHQDHGDAKGGDAVYHFAQLVALGHPEAGRRLVEEHDEGLGDH